MKLIKIKEDHYVVVDDSKIKEGDWFLPISGIGWELNKPRQADSSGGYSNGHCKKITHSTQPLEYFFTDPKNSSKVFRFDKVKYISLQEVKELIGEVDVHKKAETMTLFNLVYQFYFEEVITKDEAKRLITMLNSPDDQDKNLAREIILKKIK